MIYFDNAATTHFKPQIVIDAVTDCLKNPGNPGRGVNGSSLRNLDIVMDARISAANFFNFKNFSKVIFTSGITESMNIVINGLFSSKDHIITTFLEHNSTLRPLYKLGADLSFTDGTLKEIKKSVKKNTAAIIINHASNVTGEIQDIENIGKFCREKGFLFIVDSAQSAGVLELDCVRQCIDILCFSGHKNLLGPQGIGGLIVNTNRYIRPFIVGGTGVQSFSSEQPEEYPEHLEAGTLPVPSIAGLSKGIEYVSKYGIDKIRQHETALRNRLKDFLQSYNKFIIYEHPAKEHLGIIAFNIDGLDASYIGDILFRNFGIDIRTGTHCAPLCAKHYKADTSVRVSFGIDNTVDEVDTLINALKSIL